MQAAFLVQIEVKDGTPRKDIIAAVRDGIIIDIDKEGGEAECLQAAAVLESSVKVFDPKLGGVVVCRYVDGVFTNLDNS